MSHTGFTEVECIDICKGGGQHYKQDTYLSSKGKWRHTPVSQVFSGHIKYVYRQTNIETG